MEKLKVLISDKDIYARKWLAEAVDGTEFGKVIHTCSSDTIALDWLAQIEIDVVLLDVYFLKLGGMNILKKMVESSRELRIVITGTNDPGDARIAMDALKLGAMDILLKPSSVNKPINMEGLTSYLQTLFAQMMITRYSQQVNSPDGVSVHPVQVIAAGKSIPVPELYKKKAVGFDLLLIASSTGGPRALETVLTALPSSFNKPVLVVQHMPADFTRVLAQALDKKCNLKVLEAKNKDVVKPRQIYIAPGDMHMLVNRSGGSEITVALSKTSPVNGVRPSADVLFESVAQNCQDNRILVVILTGMGNDGTKGLIEIKKHCDCYCITQSESSCTVYGMPKSAYEAGLSDEIADIGMIAKRIHHINISGG